MSEEKAIYQVGPVGKLMAAIKEFGLPSYHFYSGAVIIIIDFDEVSESDMDITFSTAGQKVVIVSKLNDVKLKEQRRPANLINCKCKLCYAILDEEDECQGYLYWEE